MLITTALLPGITNTNWPPHPRLSSRILIQTGDNVGIAGFVIGGSDPKKLIDPRFGTDPDGARYY